MNGETNQSTGDNGSVKVVMTFGMFYKACETLKKHKQAFLDKRPTSAEAAKMLTELCGFSVSRSAVPAIKESCGIDWRPRFDRGGGKSGGATKTGDAIEVLTRAVHRLYEKLGENESEGLKRLYARINGLPESE